jgi:hypothetical protein
MDRLIHPSRLVFVERIVGYRVGLADNQPGKKGTASRQSLDASAKAASEKILSALVFWRAEDD